MLDRKNSARQAAAAFLTQKRANWSNTHSPPALQHSKLETPTTTRTRWFQLSNFDYDCGYDDDDGFHIPAKRCSSLDQVNWHALTRVLLSPARQIVTERNRGLKCFFGNWIKSNPS